MKRVTSSRINAIQNAGTMIDTMDFHSGLSDRERTDHHTLGQLLCDNAEEVVRLLIKIHNQ